MADSCGDGSVVAGRIYCVDLAPGVSRPALSPDPQERHGTDENRVGLPGTRRVTLGLFGGQGAELCQADGDF